MMNILQVSLADIEGGAEKIAWTLHHSYCARGHDSWLAVGRKKTNAPNILRIPQETYRSVWERFWETFSRVWYPHRNRHRMFARLYWVCFELGSGHLRDGLHGLENFNFPATHHVLELPPRTPEILHCHNLHGNYFDLRELPFLSHRAPMVLTLHDAWMVSGHCAHSFDCERWKIGCGNCPDLKSYPGLVRDATAENWQRKRNIYAHSHLYIATPCQWLLEKVQQSILAQSTVMTRVIPYGINLKQFYPGDKRSVREKLGLPINADILLFAANGIRHNVFKDFRTLRAAILRVAEHVQQRPIIFVALGESAPREQIGQVQMMFVPFRYDAEVVAQHYQAADMYVHAARADTFPNTVLEALACGTPVIATAVGGIPEQIRHAKTGLLVPPGEPNALSEAILSMLQDNVRLNEMGKLAADDARQRFDMVRMTDNYLDWYQEISESRRANAG
ncbi:glycosyl transferase-like protein [Candidatus Moduliflexus flocculans]|uniref:Glycosyl transferase-like protein n=1 Tax=Candidatus Moduliflexus flocculans TaxID=1499966 RepID=A0A081BMV9_9BACT|nr:glycosyl transferase-like protein [Candidatus Moduliflexus flocculans]